MRVRFRRRRGDQHYCAGSSRMRGQPPPQRTYPSGPERVLVTSAMPKLRSATCRPRWPALIAGERNRRRNPQDVPAIEAYARQKITEQWADEYNLDRNEVPVDQGSSDGRSAAASSWPWCSRHWRVRLRLWTFRSHHCRPEVVADPELGPVVAKACNEKAPADRARLNGPIHRGSSGAGRPPLVRWVSERPFIHHDIRPN